MNLSEIRKKAQQERLAGQRPEPAAIPHGASEQVAASNVPTPTPPAAPAPVVVAAEILAPPLFSPSIAVRAEVPPPRPEVEPSTPHHLPPHFDPVTQILAGRMDALTEEEAESIALNVMPDEEAFEEYLCFRVATERYAISIMEIKEITRPRELTEVPRVPDFVAGVISLRGVIVPIFDLKKRLHLAPVSDAGKTRIIVVKKGEDFLGILVDEVIQVVKVPTKSIEQPPAVLEGIDREFVRGIGRQDGRMLILLHLGKILDLSLT